MILRISLSSQLIMMPNAPTTVKVLPIHFLAYPIKRPSLRRKKVSVSRPLSENRAAGKDGSNETTQLVQHAMHPCNNGSDQRRFEGIVGIVAPAEGFGSPVIVLPSAWLGGRSTSMGAAAGIACFVGRCDALHGIHDRS